MELCRINANNIQYFTPLMDDEIKTLYHSDNALGAIGAVWEETACGLLVYRYDGVSINIVHLAVSDGYRRKKVATSLVDALCRGADDDAIPIVCDFFTDGEPEEDERVAFFESMYCFSCETAPEAIYTVSRKAMEQSVLSDYFGKIKTPAKNIYDLPARTIQQMFRQIRVTEATVGWETDVIKDLCLYRGKPEDPNSVVFVRRGETPTQPVLSYAWKNPERASSKALLFVLAEAFHKLLDRKPKIEELQIAAITAGSEQLTRHLFPEIKTAGRGFSAAWDIGNMPLPYGEKIT